jgi:gas vesicle protein
MASFGSFFTGLLAGAAIGMLYAPKRGSEIREILSRPIEKAEDLYDEFEDEFSSSSSNSKNKRKSSSSKTDRTGFSGKSSSGGDYGRTEKESGFSTSENIKRGSSKSSR